MDAQKVASTAHKTVSRISDKLAVAKRAKRFEEGLGAITRRSRLAIGIAFLAIGLVIFGFFTSKFFSTGYAFYDGAFENHPIASLVLFIVSLCCQGVVGASFVAIGIMCIASKLRLAHIIAYVAIGAMVAAALCELMLEGLTPLFWVLCLVSFCISLLFTAMDPSLSEERKLKRTLRDMEVKEEQEEGVLGRDETGKGYIQIDFFNLFWIFVIASFVGDCVETVYHYLIEVPGEFQIRAGMLYGPFSPIYGFGATILTVVLNRFYKSNTIIVFVASALIGGAFEYFVSWFLEFAFGAVAWDYSGRFLNIDGRTDFMFMCMWGILGVLWIKWLLPIIMGIISKIPWKVRYTLTAVCATLFVIDGLMTLFALDCWYMRASGNASSDSAYLRFFNENYDDSYMESRFESMSIFPDKTTRVV